MMMMMPDKNVPSSPGGARFTRSADGEVMVKVMAKRPVRSRTERFASNENRRQQQQQQHVDDNTSSCCNNNNNNNTNSNISSSSRQSSCSPVKPVSIPPSPLGDEIDDNSNNNDNHRSTSPSTNNTSNNNNNGGKACSGGCRQAAIKHKEREIEKLRKDLARCQSELREEVEKRGQSTSARATFDRERSRLLKEVRDLGVSKRRLESALEEASSALKKKTQEVRLVREAGRQEVAALERSANQEVKKLLEDLKAKDHLLAMLDRNQYSDRSNQIKLIQKQQLQESRSKTQSPIVTTTTATATTAVGQPSPDSGTSSEAAPRRTQGSPTGLQSPIRHPRKGEGTNGEEINILRKKIADLEKQLSQASLEKIDLERRNKDIQATKQNLEVTIARLRDDNMQLGSDLNAVQYEVKRLNDALASSNVEEMIIQFERLKSETGEQKSLIQKLRRQIERNEKKEKKQANPSPVPEKTKKTVRFMLPGYSDPIVNGRVAFREGLRYLFEDVPEEDEEDENYRCYGDDEVQFCFDDDDADGDADVEDDEREEEEVDDEEDDDEDAKDDSIDTDCKSSQESSVVDDDDDDVFAPRDSSAERQPEEANPNEVNLPPAEDNSDYKLLMREHLQLEQSVANLSQSLPPHNWLIEKESLQLAIMSLENKNHECQVTIDGLRSKLEELREKNEELEFQVLEFEGSGNEVLKQEQEMADFSLIERNNKLEREIRALQVQLLRTSNSSLDSSIASRSEESHSTADAETQWNNTDPEEDILECDQVSVSEAALISTSTSGFEDLSSDEEVSLDSMPQDEKSPRAGLADTGRHPKSRRSEEHWIKLAKKLEMQLTSSRTRERQLQDKLALLCEEKSRIIRDFDRYAAASDTDSLVELDSGIDVKSLDGDSGDQRGVRQLGLDFSVDFGRAGHLDDSFHLGTPTSGDLCFPKHVQSLTVEDETDALHQRVCHLEKDCELLREIVDMDEGIIRDLHVKVDELEGSERNLGRVVDRLESVERALKASESAAIEENARLKVELTRSRSVEENLQSQLDLARCDASQLRHKLDEAVDELRQTEQRLKRRTADSERERRALAESRDRLEDQAGELEAVVELLKRRNQNLQRLCEDTNARLTESEDARRRLDARLESMERQRDTFIGRIQALEREKQSAAEKAAALSESLSSRTRELDASAVEIGGLRARLESCEQDVDRWRRKADCRGDAEVLLTNEMEELRRERDQLQSELGSDSRGKLARPRLHSTETQTDALAAVLDAGIRSSRSKDDIDVEDEEEETVMAVTDDDDDDDDEASMDDPSDQEQELDEDLPLDNIQPKHLGQSLLVRWGSLDTLWSRLGCKNSSFGNSKEFRDKFTQTLAPLIPYLRRIQANSLVTNKFETKYSSKTSLIPLNVKYFNQSNASNSYISRPPAKMTVQSNCATSKADLRSDESLETSPAPVSDLPSGSVLESCCCSVAAATQSSVEVSVGRPRSPGPCASQ